VTVAAIDFLHLADGEKPASTASRGAPFWPLRELPLGAFWRTNYCCIEKWDGIEVQVQPKIYIMLPLVKYKCLCNSEQRGAISGGKKQAQPLIR
jgi:hypothetical protein